MLPACTLCLLLTCIVTVIQKSTYIARCVSEKFFLSGIISRDVTFWFAEGFFSPFLQSEAVACLLLY